MNPRAVFVMALVVLVVLVLLVWLAVWWTGRQAGVRRDTYRRMQAERDSAVAALERIDQTADCFRDIDDPNTALASQVRQVVRENRQERLKIT